MGPEGNGVHRLTFRGLVQSAHYGSSTPRPLSPRGRMKKPQAFLVVGHSNWGKSRTVRALTGDRWGRVSLIGHTFFVRLMSNDDLPLARYQSFIRRLRPARDPLVVAPYCPEQSRNNPLLRTWAERYSLRFWVLEHSYVGDRRITAEEIAQLRRYGSVDVFPRCGAEATDRARALTRFIASHV